MKENTPDVIQKFFDNCPDEVTFCPFDNRGRYEGGRSGFIVGWSKSGKGYGEITIVLSPDAKSDDDNLRPSGKAVIYSEMMGKEFVKEMLCKLVDAAELAE